MRLWLYGSLAVLGVVTAIAVVVTGTTRDTCTIVCAWQVPLVVIGTGASVGFLVVAACAIAFEVGQAALRRRRHT
jgi:hypothetical protein